MKPPSPWIEIAWPYLLWVGALLLGAAAASTLIR
jgi:hypothetical protein